jgi:hypothetical protein
VLKLVVNTVYITSGLIMLSMFINNVKADAEVDSVTSATYIDCMNCDEID